jgi:hypothetical protein
MKMWSIKMLPVSVTLAVLALVLFAGAMEQPAAGESLPQTPLLEQGSAVPPYNPPIVNSPSERVIQSNQSFQLNRGVGINPMNRDEYVREQLNK